MSDIPAHCLSCMAGEEYPLSECEPCEYQEEKNRKYGAAAEPSSRLTEAIKSHNVLVPRGHYDRLVKELAAANRKLALIARLISKPVVSKEVEL